MAKVTLAKEPTFEAEVRIPAPGVGSALLNMTFKWRSKTEMKEFLQSIEDKAQAGEKADDVKIIMEMATAWELPSEFNAENINELLEKYVMAPQSIFQTYIDELTIGRIKN